MIRVGLIGAGFMGRNHYNQYEKLTDKAKVIALCDKEADRRVGDWSGVGGNVADAEGTKRDLGDIKPYRDWHEMVANPDVDMVDICVPTNLHPEMTIEALKAGKHVLCEKPMALTVEECEKMIAAAASAKGQLMIAQTIRFWPEYVYLKEVVDDNRYGQLMALHLRRQAATPDFSLGNWMLDAKISGGAILDLHVHDVDFVIALLGKPKSVYAQGYQVTPQGIDRVHASWNYGPNRVVQLEGFWDMPAGYDFNMGFTARFEKAAIDWDMKTGKPVTVYHQDGKDPETPEIVTEDGYFTEISYFLDCIASGKDPEISTPQESRDAVMMALAEEQSLRTAQPVTIQ